MTAELGENDVPCASGSAKPLLGCWQQQAVGGEGWLCQEQLRIVAHTVDPRTMVGLKCVDPLTCNFLSMNTYSTVDVFSPHDFLNNTFFLYLILLLEYSMQYIEHVKYVLTDYLRYQ